MNQSKRSIAIGGVGIGAITLIIIFMSFYFPRQTEQGAEQSRRERQEPQQEELVKDISGDKREEETITLQEASYEKEDGTLKNLSGDAGLESFFPDTLEGKEALKLLGGNTEEETADEQSIINNNQ